MIWAKNKQTLTLSGGSASANTNYMRGVIEQVIVTPTTSTNVWDLTLTDRDGDIVYSRTSETGTLNDRTARIPIGSDSSEKLTISFANGTINEDIKIIFRVKEES